MTVFCKLADLNSESDVEQKLLWHVLTTSPPLGLGFTAADIATKRDIRSLTIGKGTTQKLFYPDYCAIIAGLPILIAEAKRPGEDLQAAFSEALRN